MTSWQPLEYSMTFNSQLKTLWFSCLPADDVTAGFPVLSLGASWGTPDSIVMLVRRSDFWQEVLEAHTAIMSCKFFCNPVLQLLFIFATLILAGRELGIKSVRKTGSCQDKHTGK